MVVSLLMARNDRGQLSWSRTWLGISYELMVRIWAAAGAGGEAAASENDARLTQSRSFSQH